MAPRLEVAVARIKGRSLLLEPFFMSDCCVQFFRGRHITQRLHADLNTQRTAHSEWRKFGAATALCSRLLTVVNTLSVFRCIGGKCALCPGMTQVKKANRVCLAGVCFPVKRPVKFVLSSVRTHETTGKLLEAFSQGLILAVKHKMINSSAFLS
jgi:hypothetical protein